MVMAKFSRTKKRTWGVPNFTEGSLILYKIGDPRVPKILENWGSGSPISCENGDQGSPFWGAPFSLDTGTATAIPAVPLPPALDSMPSISHAGKVGMPHGG